MDRQHLDFATAMDAAVGVNAPADNAVWSPYSVASAVGVAAAGARGRTRDELVDAISPGVDVALTERSLARSAQLRDASAAVANTLWTRADVIVHDRFREAVLGWPGGGHEKADFLHDPDGARQMINQDVERTTHGLIRELLQPGVIHPEVAAVIVNALYLKVAWAMPFMAAQTTDETFRMPSGDRRVPTMHQQEQLAYAEADGWRMVGLPTVSEITVDVLLPPEDEAGEAVAVPDADTVLALQDSARTVKVDLALPRFRVETGFDLEPPLRSLGVDAAFDRGRADFSGIADVPMFIETAVHKAVLDVDEQGFEGAAATALVVRMTSLDMSRPVEFQVDRPFIVIVRHRRTGAIYFLARVTEPAI